MVTPRSGRRRVVALGAVAAVLVLIAAVVGVKVYTAHTKSERIAAEYAAARVAGERYLQALASGDAKTALALSLSPPADAHLLTDEVLKAGLAALPVTNIAVTALDPVGTEIPRPSGFIWRLRSVRKLRKPM